MGDFIILIKNEPSPSTNPVKNQGLRALDLQLEPQTTISVFFFIYVE